MKLTEIIQSTGKSVILSDRYDSPRTIVVNTELPQNMRLLSESIIFDLNSKVRDCGYPELLDVFVHICLYMKSNVDTIVLYTNQEKSWLTGIIDAITGILERHEFDGEFVVMYRCE